MGYPATTEPPQHYSRRRVYSLAVLPAAFTPARSRRRTLNIAPNTAGAGSFGAPPPLGVRLFLPLPFLFLRKYCVFYTAFNGAPEALITE